MEGPAARGRRRRWRAGAGDLGRPEMGKTAWAAMQGSRRCVAPWRGRGRRGGAFGHSGGVERRWWLRLRRAAATAVLGCASERAREERRRNGESESGPGGCVASSGRRGDRQRGRRWPGRVPARSGHAPASYCPRRKTTGMATVVGWAATVEGQVSGLPGERQVVLLSLSISVFISVF